MKKSKIVFIVNTVINSIIGLCFPYALIFIIFIGLQRAVMWTLIVLLSAAFLGTAIAANIAAGYNPKTRWYAAVLPTIVFVVPWMFILGDMSNYADFWLFVIGGAVTAAVCVLSMALTWRKQVKKQNKVLNEAI